MNKYLVLYKRDFENWALGDVVKQIEVSNINAQKLDGILDDLELEFGRENYVTRFVYSEKKLECF